MTAHEEMPRTAQMLLVHRFRHRPHKLFQGLRRVGRFVQVLGHVWIPHPANHARNVRMTDFHTQKSRSGFFHIAYLTVKYLKALLCAVHRRFFYMMLY